MTNERAHAGLEYRGLHQIQGPLIFVPGVDRRRIRRVRRGHLRRTGTVLHGRVLEVQENMAVVEVLEGTAELSVERTSVRFLGHSLQIPVAREMLGRVFDALGRPLDGGPPPLAEHLRDVNGEPINPVRRDYPRDCIQTGISTIDGMNTLVRGQKLPIFSGSGLPHNQLAAQIVRQATPARHRRRVRRRVRRDRRQSRRRRVLSDAASSRAAPSATRSCSSTSPTTRASSGWSRRAPR